MHLLIAFILVFSVLSYTPFFPVNASSALNEDYESGEELYDLACANCHGKNMHNPGNTSFNLNEFPKDEKQRFIESVINGKGLMPALGQALVPEELEQLWFYISQKNKLKN